MIQPMISASRTKAMNPPSNGQYMAHNIYERGAVWPRSDSGVQRDLLAGRRERPRHLQAALLTKDEVQLAGGPQTVRMCGAESRAGSF
jgi:hypothetical protein